MNVLIVSQYYHPEQFLINDIAPELVKRGHQVTVLCGLPNYPKGIIYPGYEDSYKKDELLNGVRIIRCKQTGRGSSLKSLFFNYLSFAFYGSLKILSLKDKYDIIFCYQLSPVTIGIPGIIYRIKHKVPSLLYCLDIWPESIYQDIKNKKNLIYKFVHILSKYIYNKYDKIIVSSRSFIGYLNIENEVNKNKLLYVPQHSDAKMLELDMSNGKTNVVSFMFAGNLGTSQDLDVIVKAAEILGARNDYLIHFVGDGSFKDKLHQLIKNARLDNNFVFHGSQARSDMPNFYKKSDVLLVTLKGTDATGDTLPSKVQNYMTTGKPIFGAINGDASITIKDAKCGQCVHAGDFKGLAQLMLQYIKNRETYDKLGENGRKYFKSHFTLEVFVDRLEKEMNEVSSYFK